MKHKNISIFVPHAGCPHQCIFCDQKTISSVQNLPDEQYVEAVCQKAFYYIPKEQWSQTEIAFFGGSFTAIEPGYMERLLRAANRFVGINGFSGIRISTRPDCIDIPTLELLQNYGVTSIELGVQSLDDRVLELNSRGHTSQQAEDACKLIHSYKFSLGLQMMVGMYGDSKESLYRTADKIIALNPDTIRIYPVVVLKNTYLEELYCNGTYQPMPLRHAVTVCADLLDMFESHNIKVIRLGLHSEAEMKENIVAGIYHPAFRELCESKRMLNRVYRKLENIKGRKILIRVHPSDVSKLIGQHRGNISELNRYGYQVQVQADASLQPKQIKIKDVSNCC